MISDARVKKSITLSKEADALLRALAEKHSRPESYAVEAAIKIAAGVDGIAYIEDEGLADIMKTSTESST